MKLIEELWSDSVIGLAPSCLTACSDDQPLGMPITSSGHNDLIIPFYNYPEGKDASGLRDRSGQNGRKMEMKRQKQPQIPDRKLLTPIEVCAQFSISRRTLHRIMARGELQGIRIGGSFRFRLSDVDAYLAKNAIQRNDK